MIDKRENDKLPDAEAGDIEINQSNDNVTDTTAQPVRPEEDNYSIANEPVGTPVANQPQPSLLAGYSAYYYGSPHTKPQYNQAAFTVPPKAAAPKRNRIRQSFAAVALVLMLLFGSGLYVVASNSSSAVSNTLTVQPATSTSNTVQLSTTTSTSGTLLTIQQVNQLVRPAVVQITTQIASTNTSSRNGSGTSVATGVGSGIIYDAAGYILTNAHVVEGANSLLVTAPDGRSFTGTVVGADTQTDLAVVKIDATGQSLPVAQLGDSDALQVGDGLVAIGNALALPGGPTVTSGIVSALERSVTEPASTSGSNAFGVSTTSTGPQLYDLIQTDAAINPGNSGGPLINMYGQVVGINTLGAGTDESGDAIEGIGFAISINQAKAIAQQLVENGKVSHAYLDISYQPLTPALATSLKLDSSQTALSGAVIEQVASGSPAASAGLQKGDIIVSIDGKTLTSESALGEVISTHKAGDTLTLQVITPAASGGNNTAHTVTVTLTERTGSNQS